jgi:hypothetical protein
MVVQLVIERDSRNELLKAVAKRLIPLTNDFWFFGPQNLRNIFP